MGLYRLKFGKLIKQYTWNSRSADAPFEPTWYQPRVRVQERGDAPIARQGAQHARSAVDDCIDRQINTIAMPVAPRVLLSRGKNVEIVQSYVRGMGMDILPNASAPLLVLGSLVWGTIV